MGEIAHVQRSLDAIHMDMHESIERIKRASEAFAAPRRARLEALVAELSTFAERNKPLLFARKRGIELTHGMLGFRRTRAIRPPIRGGWGGVLQKIKALGASEAIRVREDVNRAVLRGWSVERLAQLGIESVRSDLFWYELKVDNLHPDATPSSAHLETTPIGEVK
ncbi:MAG: host-nuclease inhibitor Gam family protein [Magnetococcales bacterium]|nr:host-nuclease inhibitor Gam family protein [Magnetococcales bacterium]